MYRAFDALIAHQGGWDELALFAIPVLLALAGVRFVERRHRKDQMNSGEKASPSEPDTIDDDDPGATLA
jgi:hypothetical protein